MDRTWLALGSASMFLAVAAGAFGAHALKERLAPDMLAVYEVAVRYQAYHALALLAVALIADRQGGAAARAAGIAFTAGTLLFSGSLYALALTGARWLGAVTPMGGVLFLLGWLSLVWSAVAPVLRR
jgi:uncharacterized membrane protein YgdD (TMEM256/DUF423 family)